MKRQITVVIFSASSESETELRNAFKTVQGLRVVASSDQMEQAYADVVQWRPSAVIISLDKQPEVGWMLCRQITAICPETTVICASQDSSSDMILDSLRAGAREFLRLPAVAEDLATVFDRVAEFSAKDSQDQKKQGRVIALYSGKGGCGTSFLAANLALTLDAPTVLVDLNLQAGGLEIFFGVKPKYSIADMVANRDRLDDQLLSSYLVPYSPNLSLLPAPQEIEDADRLQPEHLLDVIYFLRARFEYVVLDLPHGFDPLTIGVLDQTDDILLVLTLDILASRAAQRALTILYRLGYARQKVRLILNRWSKQSDLELRHVERFLGERITCFVSDDYRAAVNSINLGKPLVTTSSTAPIVAELKNLAAICGVKSEKTTAEPRKNLFSTLFRRQTGELKKAEKAADLTKPVTAKLG